MSTEQDISPVRVVPVLSQDEWNDFVVTESKEEIDEDISKSETIILKAITHRGTQTVIHCDPKLPKEDFINILVKLRI